MIGPVMLRKRQGAGVLYWPEADGRAPGIFKKFRSVFFSRKRCGARDLNLRFRPTPALAQCRISYVRCRTTGGCEDRAPAPSGARVSSPPTPESPPPRTPRQSRYRPWRHMRTAPQTRRGEQFQGERHSPNRPVPRSFISIPEHTAMPRRDPVQRGGLAWARISDYGHSQYCNPRRQIQWPDPGSH